jgi:hypothetical protein
MGKVLYIEDELTCNIGAISKYFNAILAGRNLLQPLAELEQKSGVLPRDVVNICNKASELDVVYKFPVALTKIVHRSEDYDLIIMDRDLSSYNYAAETEKIRTDLEFAGLSDPAGKAQGYRGREGDLLLMVLLRTHPSHKDKVYLLAEQASGVIKSSEELETLVDVMQFPADRILEKGAQAEQVIGSLMADLPAFTIQNTYQRQCDILRKRFSEEAVDSFVTIAKLASSVETKIDFLQKLRPLTETFLVTLAEKVNDLRAPYWFKLHGKLSLQQKDFINSLDKIDSRFNLGYNKNIRQCLYSLWQIPSDFASHTSGNQDDITVYTITALFNQLCDVILWFDKAMEKLQK